MYNATVIEIFLASPTDIKEERKIVHDIIEEWNIANSNKYKIILKTLRWEKNVYSSLGNHPQDEINEQILKKADLLIGIFWTRLGSATESHESGTIEEISKHIELEKPAMIYFSNAAINPSTIDNEQYQKVQSFKNSINKKGIYFEYDNLQKFEELIRNQLALMINNDKFFTNITNFYKTQQNLAPKLSSENSDLILFLDNLNNFRINNKNLHNFIENIGSYRFGKILPILKSLKILSGGQSGNGNFHLNLLVNFNTFNDKDIENIKNDVLSGNSIN